MLVTGVGGQLGHDVVNAAAAKEYETIGSDIGENYSGVADGSAVMTAPYVQLLGRGFAWLDTGTVQSSMSVS